MEGFVPLQEEGFNHGVHWKNTPQDLRMDVFLAP